MVVLRIPALIGGNKVFPQRGGVVLNPVAVAAFRFACNNFICKLGFTRGGKRMENIAQPYHSAGVYIAVAVHDFNKPFTRRGNLVLFKKSPAKRHSL